MKVKDTFIVFKYIFPLVLLDRIWMEVDIRNIKEQSNIHLNG